MRNLLKAFLKTSAGSMAAIAFGVITTKVIATFSGPAGVGLMSVLRQSQQLLVSVATLQGGTALVQGLSSSRIVDKDSYLATVASLMLGMSVLVCLVIWFAAPILAEVMLNRQDAQAMWLLRGLMVGVLFAAGVAYLSALLNGYRAIGRLALVQVGGAAAGAIVVYPLLTWLDTPWGLALILWVTSGVSFTVSLLFAGRAGWLSPLFKSWSRLWDQETVRYFLRFAGTTIVTGLIGTGTVLLIRAMFIRHSGLDGAGIFDVAWTLSTVYIMIVLGSLGTYYTPTLASTADLRARKELMAQVFRAVVLLGAPLVTLIVVGKPLVVQLLYTKEFLPALDIIQWMLIGDYFKIVAWVLATPMLAFADLRTFLWSELVWYAGMALGSWLSLFVFDTLWMVGATFLAMYLFYMLFCAWYAKTKHGFRLNKSEIVALCAGGIIVIGTSFIVWDEQQVRWPVVAWLMPVLAGFVWFGTSAGQRSKMLDCLKGRFQGRKHESAPN